MTTKLLLSGPIEGHLQKFYNEAAKQNPNWIICCGSYGVWPDPNRMNRAAKKFAGRDFSKAYVGAILLSQIPTLFVAGPHEDHRFLNERIASNNTEVLANVHFLANGFRTEIGWDKPLRVTGLGKVYSQETYSGQLGKNAHRHYTRRDIERGCSSGPCDLLIIHESLDSPGIRNLIYATRPKLILTAKHPNQIVHETVQNIPVIYLGKGETQLINL